MTPDTVEITEEQAIDFLEWVLGGEDEKEPYHCPRHGWHDGPDCPRC